MPKAVLIYDKFHFMQFICKALDEIRKVEAKNNKLLKWSRYLWLYNKDKLKDEELIKLEELKSNNKVLSEAYQMKENIKEFFEKEDIKEAEEFLETWCRWVMESKIEPMKKVVKTIKAHWSGILNYIEKRINTEWINSIIQTIKRRARWYRNSDNFKTMIYLKIWDFEICQAT